jgi:cyclic pyranopterin phosphate synthase
MSATEHTAESPSELETRLLEKQERVHILTGAVCNNNCIFCMEEDRDGRYETNSQTTDDVVRTVLEHHAGCEEVCFTSGEPTTNPRLPRWVKMAKDAGVSRISIMTNARLLSAERNLKVLLAAGMRRFYVSIHGHEEALHKRLVRTPGAFEQTVAGIRNIARYGRLGVELHTSTVVTKRNLPHLAEIYRFLRGLGVHQVVFNVMQANGRADTNFDLIFPRYTEIAAVAAEFVEAQSRVEPEVMAFFVDIPLCTTESLPAFNRGYVESYAHYEPDNEVNTALLGDKLVDRRVDDGKTRLLVVKREDLDDAERLKRDACRECRYDHVCEGVWKNYLQRYGWDEMRPVPRPAGSTVGTG